MKPEVPAIPFKKWGYQVAYCTCGVGDGSRTGCTQGMPTYPSVYPAGYPSRRGRPGLPATDTTPNVSRTFHFNVMYRSNRYLTRIFPGKVSVLIDNFKGSLLRCALSTVEPSGSDSEARQLARDLLPNVGQPKRTYPNPRKPDMNGPKH